MKYFVDENNVSAVRDAEEFASSSIYATTMCGAKLGNGIREEGFYEALDRLAPYSITKEERVFYENFYQTQSVPRCWLPKQHTEQCSSRAGKFFAEVFSNKLSDCVTAPGADDVVFKNRCARYFPIQISASNERSLRKKFDLKQTVKLKAAVPLEQATTGYLSATASLDIAALILGQKDAPATTLTPNTVKLLMQHQRYLVKHYKQQKIEVINASGNLCDPWTLEPLDFAWWLPSPEGKDPKQIQFGHVQPISPQRYMTRGLNVIPMLRQTNIMQGDRSFSEFMKETMLIADKHK